MNTKKIKWATIFPLIGGFPIAAEQAFNKHPEFVLSYTLAKNNDQYYLRYLNETKKANIPYYVIDDENFDVNKLYNVDVVVGTPICSGLSMLNTSINKKSAKSRGGDAIQNETIYNSTEFSLKHLKPKVFVGENAPNLFSDAGLKVREKLYEIAKKYNYSVSFYKTDTVFHGIPQKRQRTFYFLWKNKYAPILNFINKPRKNYKEYMLSYPGELNQDDLTKTKKFVETHPAYIFVTQVLKQSPEDLFKNKYFSLLAYLKDNLDKYIEWLKEQGATVESTKKPVYERTNYESCLRVALHYKNKFEQGKGVWDATLIFPSDTINSLINKTHRHFVHPEGNRTLTTREKGWLMGMPIDFPIDDIEGKTIGQNVPVTTAKDIIEEIKNYLEGNLKMSDSNYFMQNNMAQKIVNDQIIKSNSLF